MTDLKQEFDVERRLSRVEQSLADHMKTCEANSTEAKYWLRFLGTSVFAALMALAVWGFEHLLSRVHLG